MKFIRNIISSTFAFIIIFAVFVFPASPIDFPGFPQGEDFLAPNRIQEKAPTQGSNANVFSQAANAGVHFLATKPDSAAASRYLQREIDSEVSQQLKSLFNPFGTARVQIESDENISLKNSAFDLLIPLWQTEHAMTFNQTSLHRSDDRAQLNVGLGLRYFSDSVMYGGNLFFDYDLSGYHRRLGAGIEHWRDNLKLSVNYYTPLSDWRSAKTREDYDARPANGWDTRANVWLPAWPQLGAMLVFEQYYGDEVALFNIENRLKDPYAITVGVNYTPFPLLTFSAEHRQGKSDTQDHRLSLQFTVGLDSSWRQQLSPAAVSSRRSLAGSRNDLVERNNTIVLEYRKQQVITFMMTGALNGAAGERKPLGISVNARHGFSHLEWSSASLLEAGGQIISGLTPHQQEVILPRWRSDNLAPNIYSVSAIAVDKRGNRSPSQTLVITVNSPASGATQSSITPARSQLPADGVSMQELVLTLTDEQFKPIDEAVDDITLRAESDVASSTAVVSALKRRSAGIYTLTVTAGMQEERLTLTASARGGISALAQVQITSRIPSAAYSTLTLSPSTIEADGIATSTLTIQLKDSDGKPISGNAERISLAIKQDTTRNVPALPTLSHLKETAPGIYSAALSGTTAGKFTLIPGYAGDTEGDFAQLSVNVTLTAPVSQTTIVGINTHLDNAGTDFSLTSSFPKTGFRGATFTIKLSAGVDPRQFTWTSDQSWVTVDPLGEVLFSGEPSSGSKTVTITATSAVGKTLAYTFTLESWFINSGDTMMSRNEAADYCARQGNGYQFPYFTRVSGADALSDDNVRGKVGRLTSEWGAMGLYGNGWKPWYYWVDGQQNDGWTSWFYVYQNGSLSNGWGSESHHALCYKAL
ncbi:inverse autotransporter beta domain-containing protein [Pseudomonas graminis]